MTTRDRALGMLVSAAFAAVGAAWFLERQGRIEAEAEVSRLLAERASREGRERAARTAARASEPARADSEPLSAPVVPPVEAPRVSETAPQKPPLMQEGSTQVAPAGSLDLAAFLKSNLALEDPAEALARLCYVWNALSKCLPPEEVQRLRPHLQAQITELARRKPTETANALERLLATTTPGTLLHDGLLTGLREVDPVKAADHVRTALRSSDLAAQVDAVRWIVALPEDERMGTWRDLMRHSDPAIQAAALASGTGMGPDWAKSLEDIASVESDPGRRGQILARAYLAHPTVERLDPLLRELEFSRDTHFRLAVITGFEDTITIRDRAAIDLLRRIAENPAESAKVREETFSVLLDYGNDLVTPEEARNLEDARAKLQEAESDQLQEEE